LATSKADPLVSQFTPSFGMVLNLLQTHTLEQAKELIERSFGQYLANFHLRPQYERVDELQRLLGDTQAQIDAIDEHDIEVYEKLRQRLKAERQLLKTLQEQAQSTRQEELGMMIGFAITGTLLSLKGKNITVAAPIPAVLVGKSQGSGTSPYLVCLGGDNRWYVATTTDVVDLYGELPRLDLSPNLLPPASMPIKPGQSRRGNEETSAIASQIPEAELSSYLAPEVSQQLARVTAVQAQIEAHPLHQAGNVAVVFKRKARAGEIAGELAELQASVEQQSQRYWGEFVNLIEILQYFQCLDNLVPTQLGQIAAAIRGENELWLALVLSSRELDNLDPHHLGAVVAALVTETPRPDSFVKFDLSKEADDAWSSLRNIRRSLLKVQYRHGVALPVGLENRYINLTAIVEQWALGVEWVELCENTSLDEGDVVRILRRTLDLLSQIPHVPYLQDALYKNARRAMQLIDRFPVNEVVE